MRWVGVLALLVWAALTTAVAVALPPCRIDAVAIDQRVATAAGCFIQWNRKLLLVRYLYNGKWGLPAGFAESGEKAQCTAHRETWEETGIRVEVGPLLQRFGNGFLLYRCRPLVVPEAEQGLAVPATGRAEIAEVRWLDPAGVGAEHWRFAWQYAELLRLFDSEQDE